MTFVYALLSGITLVLITLFCGSILILSSLMIRDEKTYYNTVGRWVPWLWASVLVGFSRYILGNKVVVYNKDLLRPGNIFLMMDHQHTFDILVALYLAGYVPQVGYRGYFRFFVKLELFNVPVMGGGMRKVKMVPTIREKDGDTSKNTQIFDTILSQFRNLQLPVFLVGFPEGTRNTPDQQEKRNTLVTSQGLRMLKYKMRPKVGMWLKVLEHLLEDHLDQIVVATCVYRPLVSKDIWPIFNKQMREAHIYLTEIPLELVPSEKDLRILMLNDVVEMWDDIHIRAQGGLGIIPPRIFIFDEQKARQRLPLLHKHRQELLEAKQKALIDQEDSSSELSLVS